jgi:hypothetical protein
VNLRELAEAAQETWPLEDDAARAYAAACSPERILALLDVVEAAEATPDLATSKKGHWWREEGLAGAAAADQKLRGALARWHEVSR